MSSDRIAATISTSIAIKIANPRVIFDLFVLRIYLNTIIRGTPNYQMIKKDSIKAKKKPTSKHFTEILPETAE